MVYSFVIFYSKKQVQNKVYKINLKIIQSEGIAFLYPERGMYLRFISFLGAHLKQ